MNEYQIYLTLHTLTLFSAVAGIVLSFRYYGAENMYLIASTVLHAFLCYIALRAPAGARPLSNRLLMDYSFHIIVVNVAFFFTGAPLAWGAAIALVSFYRIVEHFARRAGSGATDGIGQRARALYARLTNPPLAQSILAMLEIMAMFSRGRRIPLLMEVARQQLYLFWFVLFRYATDAHHQQFWRQTSAQLNALFSRLPQRIAGALNGALASVARLGSLATRMYRVKQQ